MSKTQSMDSLSANSGSVTDLVSTLNLTDSVLRNSNENFEMSDNSSLNEDMSNYVFDGVYDAYKVDRSAESPRIKEKIM